MKIELSDTFGKLRKIFSLMFLPEPVIKNKPNEVAFIHQSWHGLELPVGFISEENKKIYRVIERKEIALGTVVRHISGGILVKLESGETGVVEDCELDWSNTVGKKSFPVGSTHSVMVLSRRSTQRLYLSIKDTNFAEFFRASIGDLPIGARLVRPITSVMDYGFFVGIKQYIDVFIHQSDVKNFDGFKTGDLVEIHVTGYDYKRNRIIGELA